MTHIKLYDHPFSGCGPTFHQAPSIGQWLLERYGDAPSVNVQIFKGEPCAENEITGKLDELLGNDADEYVVLQSPGDPLSTFQIIQLIVVIYSVGMALVAGSQSRMPQNVNRQQQSPNNALGNRENQLRIGQRVEDIYGKVRSTPSLMMQTYQKYVQNQKYEYGYYCVGRGYYDITDVRDGDTLIADIDGASAAVYEPFTSPNSGDAPQLLIGDAIIDPVLNVSRSNSVDGITLKAPNEIELALPANYSFEKLPGGDIIRQAVDAVPNVVSIAQDGQTVVVSATPYSMPTISGNFQFSGTDIIDAAGAGALANVFIGDYIAASGSLGGAVDGGPWLITGKPNDNQITLAGLAFTFYSGYAEIDKDPIDPSGTYTIDSVGDGFLVLTASSFTGTTPLISADVTVDTGITGFTDWFTLSSKDRTEVWVNIVAQQGMYKDNGTKLTASVDYTIEIEKLNPDLSPEGTVETVTGNLSGSISDEVADTVEHATAWTGPARVRMKRTSNLDLSFVGTVVDEIKFGDLYSVSPIDKIEFGNKTTIHTVTRATARATAVKSRQLRCLAHRKLPTYNGTIFSGAFDANGLHVSGTIAATSKLVDIISAVAIDPKIGRRQISEIDVAQIWGVQQQLDAWDVECGQYNYTLDSDNTSFEETVAGIANAGFCVAYRQNGKIRLSFEKLQTSSTALFTHRNKKPRAETITRNFASDAEYDGVEFVYVDPDSEQSETIILPLDGGYTKLKKFEIAGIRSFKQAWFRANREYYKLLGQRITIETSTTLDARFVLPNGRVDIVDNTRFKSFDGEVIKQEGLTLTLSQKVEFLPSTAHSILLMKRDGTLQSIAATPGGALNKVILATLPGEAINTEYGPEGVRTIYSFAADSKRDAQAYLVQEIDITDGQYATLRAVNYSPDYYQMDYEDVPEKAAVIN